VHAGTRTETIRISAAFFSSVFHRSLFPIVFLAPKTGKRNGVSCNRRRWLGRHEEHHPSSAQGAVVRGVHNISTDVRLWRELHVRPLLQRDQIHPRLRPDHS
jgi:hypothetical protein